MSLKISAVILAGGHGTRFGSYKPDFSVHGRTLLEYLVRAIGPLYEELFVVVGTELQREQIRSHMKQKIVILTDRVLGVGPLGGILAGASSANNEYCQILPVDSPLPVSGVLIHLADCAKGYEAAIPTWPDGRLEPLHGVYKANKAVEEAEHLVSLHDYSIISLVHALTNTCFVSIETLRALDPDLETFANVNTREDIEKITSKLRERLAH